MPDIADFLAGLGVNTHQDATVTAYGNVALVRASLAYLGVSLIRDHAYDVDLDAYRTLAAAGIRLDLILDDDPKAELDSLAPVFPAIRFLEGPNEVDFQPIQTNGIADPILAELAEMQSIAAALTATPSLHGVPLLSPSLADPGALPTFAAALATATIVNLHSYAAFGASPGSILARDAAIAQSVVPLPRAITETGYATMPTDDSGVTESVQARLTLDTLFDAAALGIAPTILYELFDEADDPAQTDPQLHYGLFHADGSPKPVATAIHDLTAILATADATPGQAPALSLTVAGAPETAQTLVIPGAAGTTIVAIWAEPPLWDPATHTEITAATVPTTLDLGTTVGTAQLFDPLLGTAPIATYAGISTLTILLTDHPLLLSLSNALPVQASPAAPSRPTPTIDIYRFFETANGTHFYTASAAEAQSLRQSRPDLTPEGMGLRALAQPGTDPAAAAIYRFFDTTTGTQFLTASTVERDTVLATRPDLLFEPGSLFYEHGIAQPGDTPVYRFFDTLHGTHFYTADETERATIQATRPDLTPEGIGFYQPG